MFVAYDYETEAIEAYPNYPPKPVGLSIYVEGEEPRYYAFGHPTENNCTEDEARSALERYWNDPSVDLVAYNNPFDNHVAHAKWGLPLQPAARLHDAMVLAFLLDPHAKELGLKPQAEKWLGMPPDERDEVRDWLVENGVCRASKKSWGAFICKAPGGLVGKYANGDTERTLKLFKKLYAMAEYQGMVPAYRREMSVQSIMLRNSVEGIRVNTAKLAEDVAMFDEAITRIDAKIWALLESEPFNIDSDAELADAVDRKVPGIVWPETATGKRSTSKASMEQVLGSLAGELLACLQYRASVQTCVNTFMRVWLTQATTEGSGGRIRCNWHSTRSDDGGARTGRLSSSPNFQNIPTLESAKFAQALKLWEEWLSAEGFPPLPNVREYILADDDDSVVIAIDYSNQEVRVLAHYAEGDLLDIFKDDPRIDMHQWSADTVKSLTGVNITRKHAKSILFLYMYGGGVQKLADQLGCSEDEASTMRAAYCEAIPGIEQLNRQLKARAAQDKPIKTWGGRLYHVEPPKFDTKQGRWKTFDYKLLNVLIQGSSADLTKQAVIDYDSRKVHGRLLLTIHDEIVLSCPKEHAESEMAILRSCMEGLPLDAPLVSEGAWGPNLHDLKEFKDG